MVGEGALSRLKQHNLVIFRDNSTILGGKVYSLLLNMQLYKTSCKNRHATLKHQQKSYFSVHTSRPFKIEKFFNRTVLPFSAVAEQQCLGRLVRCSLISVSAYSAIYGHRHGAMSD